MSAIKFGARARSLGTRNAGTRPSFRPVESRPAFDNRHGVGPLGYKSRGYFRGSPWICPGEAPPSRSHRRLLRHRQEKFSLQPSSFAYDRASDVVDFQKRAVELYPAPYVPQRSLRSPIPRTLLVVDIIRNSLFRRLIAEWEADGVVRPKTWSRVIESYVGRSGWSRR